MKKVILGIFALVFCLSSFASLNSKSCSIVRDVSTRNVLFETLRTVGVNLKEKYQGIDKMREANPEDISQELVPLFNASKDYLVDKGYYESVLEEVENNEKDNRIIKIALYIALSEDKTISLSDNNAPNVDYARPWTWENIGSCLGEAIGLGGSFASVGQFMIWVSKLGLKQAIKATLLVCGETVAGPIAVGITLWSFLDCMIR